MTEQTQAPAPAPAKAPWNMDAAFEADWAEVVRQYPHMTPKRDHYQSGWIRASTAILRHLRENGELDAACMVAGMLVAGKK